MINFIPNADNQQIEEVLGCNNMFRFRIPIIKYFGEFEEYFRNFLEMKYKKGYRNRGGLFYGRRSPEGFRKSIEMRMEMNGGFEIDKKVKEKVFSIIKNNPNRFFVFLVLPVHKSFFYHYRNYDKLEELVKELNAFSNVRVFNSCKENYPDSLFLDSVHLNYYGAIKFTHDLKDSLATLKNPSIINKLKT